MPKLYIKPSLAARKAAKKGLEARKKAPKSKKGGLTPKEAGEQGIGSGVARARDIASGKRVDAKQVHSFFSRHKQNYLDAKLNGLKPEESKAIQAWLLWGGEPLRKQAAAAVKKERNKNPKNFKQVDHKEPGSTSRKPATPQKIYLVNAKALARNHPSSFKLPKDSNLRKLSPGDFVKVADDDERFWVKLTGFEGRKLHGQIVNNLNSNEYKLGDCIYLEKKNIYDARLSQ